MASWSLVLGLLLVLQPKPARVPVPETAADVVTLRDGTVVLGQLPETAARGPLVMYVRRAWAEASIPDRAKRWEQTEGPERKRAYQLRRERLAAWKRERVLVPGEVQADPIGRWLDQQLDRLDPEGDPPPAPLLVVTLNRAEVKSVVRRPKGPARMLRQGWLSGFRDVETMKPAALKEALQGRGFAVEAAAGSDDTAPLDRLLPILAETDEQWLTRRAATEAAHDPSVRFIQIQNLLLPEPSPGQALTPAGALSMVAGLAPLLDDKPVDPLTVQLRDVAARGRVGAVVTQQEMSPELDAVRITISLLVRNGDRWSKAGSRTATVRTDAVRPGAGDDLAQDPQVGAVFRVFESIGLGFSADIKQRSLNIGAATRQALASARGAFTDRLAVMGLPLEGGEAK